MRLSLGLITALLLTASAAACGNSEPPPKPVHTFRLEALVNPEGTWISISGSRSNFYVKTPSFARDTDVAVVGGPVIVTEGSHLYFSVSTDLCKHRKVCADYVLWMDGKPLARGALTRGYQNEDFVVATDGTITQVPHSEFDRKFGPPGTLTPIDPAHPEQGRLELPDDLAEQVAHGPPAKPAE